MSEVEPTEVLESYSQSYKVVLAEGTDDELTLTQRPLTFFGKMEFFSVMGRAVDRAIADGLSVSDLFDVPEREDGTINAEAFKEADMFVKAVVKLISQSEELMLEMYSVILGVPRAERMHVQELMKEEMTDEQGATVLNNFIDQNWDVMVSFFVQQVKPLFKKVSKKFQGSASSKPSRATRQTTQKQSKKS